MRVANLTFPASALLVATAVAMTVAHGHALAGQRLFPSTLSFDDPGIGAELPVTFSHQKTGGVNANDFDVGVTKPITASISFTAETGYLLAPAAHGPSAYGWDNLTLGAVWQAFVVPSTESIGALSINRSLMHTGSKAVRDDFATWSPEFDFGQGMGWLPVSWLRPLAITGALAVDLPNTHAEPRVLETDISIQYSIPYLQDFVKYVGIKAPFNNMIPVVEVPIETALDRGAGGQTTGSVNPGVIWIGHYFQLGAELTVPVNRRSGHAVGVVVGVDIYLDDVAPHGFGAPIFN